MNKEAQNLAYIIKIAKEKKEEERNSNKQMAAGAGLIGVGSLAAKKSMPKFTGRKTVYHGTDPQNVQSILSKGLLASKTGGPGSHTDIIKDLDPETYKKSLNKVYATPSKFKARTAYGGGMPGEKNYVKIKAPTWKMKTVKNPEARGNVENFRSYMKDALKKQDPDNKDIDKFVDGPAGKFMAKRLHKQFDKDVVFDQDVSNKYIKGSKNYKRNTLNEIKEYAKNNPKKFALGAGGLALGGAAAGSGAYLLGKKIKERREAKDEQSSD